MVKQIEYEKQVSAADCKKVLKQFTESQGALTCVYDDYRQIPVVEYKFRDMLFKLDAQDFTVGQTVEMHFALDATKYILRGQIQKCDNTSIELQPDYECVTIQRRDNFRINVLGPTHINFQISQHNSTMVEWEASIINVSLGGCLLEVSHLARTFHIGDELVGELVAEGFKALPIKCTVRRVQPNSVLGLEFNDLKGHALGFLNEIVMKVSREASRVQ